MGGLVLKIKNHCLNSYQPIFFCSQEVLDNYLNDIRNNSGVFMLLLTPLMTVWFIYDGLAYWCSLQQGW